MSGSRIASPRAGIPVGFAVTAALLVAMSRAPEDGFAIPILQLASLVPFLWIHVSLQGGRGSRRAAHGALAAGLFLRALLWLLPSPSPGSWGAFDGPFPAGGWGGLLPSPWFGGGSEIRLLIQGLDLLLLLHLSLLLKARGESAHALVGYAWNPFVLAALWRGTGLMGAAAAALLFGAVLLIHRKRRRIGAALWGLGAGLAGLAPFLAPALACRAPFRDLLPFALGCLGGGALLAARWIAGGPAPESGPADGSIWPAVRALLGTAGAWGTALGLWTAASVLLWRRRPPLLEGIQLLVTLGLLVSPRVDPSWGFWLGSVLVFRPQAAWLVLSGTLACLVVAAETPVMMRIAAYLPLLLVPLVQSAVEIDRRRRRRGAGGGRSYSV